MANEYLVDEARRNGVCRVCGNTMPKDASGQPKGWATTFGSMCWPEAITLNFGKEYAHTACVEEEPGDGT